MHPSEDFDATMTVAKEHVLVDDVMDLSEGEEWTPSTKQPKKAKGELRTFQWALCSKKTSISPSTALHFVELS